MGGEDEEERQRLGRDASGRLAALGGSMPDARVAPRRRPPDFTNHEWDDEAKEYRPRT